MNIYKRLFCVLLVFVLLSVQFLPLHTVHATENNDEGVEVEIIEEENLNYGIATLDLTLEDMNGTYTIDHQFYSGPNISNGLLKDNIPLALLPTLHHENIRVLKNINYNDYMEDRFIFKNVNGDKIFSKGSNIELNISNLINFLRIENTRKNINEDGVHTVYFYLKDINNKYTRYNATSFKFDKISDSGEYVLYSFNAIRENIPFDVYGVIVSYVYNYSAYGPYMPTNPQDYTVERGSSFYNSRLTFEQTPYNETKGLLGNIIQIVTNIKDGVINLPGKIADSVKGFFDNIVNAVVNLGNFLLDGIKGLFVPSEEDITQMKDKWDQLLSDRFGALYQTTELISDYANAFTSQEKNTITMPSVSISLAGADFVFGGWEVQVVPDGFGVVFDTLKLIISIVCTIWFVNGLKNRFERLVGGANNI